MCPLAIVLTGPESVGKTTLAESLAKEFRSLVINEDAREHLAGRESECSLKDLLHVYRIQYALQADTLRCTEYKVSFF